MQHPAVLLLIASLSFSIMNAAVKTLHSMPAWQIVFFRSIFALCWLAPDVIKNYHRWKIPRSQSFALLVRGVFGCISITLYFFAIEKLPLTKAVLYNYTFPLYVLLFSVLFIGERISFKSLIFITVAFFGVALTVFHGRFSLSGEVFSGGLFPNLAGMTSAMTAGVSIVAMKVATRYTSPRFIVFAFMLIAALLSAVPTALHFQMPTPQEWLILAVIGFFGTSAQEFMTRGFAGIEASTGGVIAMATVVFSSLWGWIFWHEPVHFITVLGVFLVALGIYGAYRFRV